MGSQDTTPDGGEQPPIPEEKGKSIRQVKDVFRRALNAADLGEYEKEVLTTLVFEGRLDAGTISEKADVPQSKVYDVLSRLQGSGLVYCQNEAARPKIFVAVRPELIINTLTEPYREILEVHESVEAELTEFYEAGLQGVADDHPSDYVASQTTKGGIASELFSAIDSAGSIYAVGRDFTWLLETPQLVSIVRNMAEAGGKVRLLSNEEEPGGDLVSLAKDLEGCGAEIRVGGRHQSRYVILDEEKVLLGVRRRNPKATEPDYVLVRLNSSDFAHDLLGEFSSAWAEATDVEV